MKYRVRGTGEIKSYTQIKREARGTRHTPPESHWTEATYRTLRVDPVFTAPRPDVPEITHRLESAGVALVGGRWTETWAVVPRALGDVRISMRAQVAQERERRANAGPNSTVADIARLFDAYFAGVFSTWGDERIAPAEAMSRYQTAVQHREACYDRAAKLNQQIDRSDDPTGIDISGGWPE